MLVTFNRQSKECWPFNVFDHIALIKGRMYNKLYIFGILMTLQIIWYAYRHHWNIFEFWPLFELCLALPGQVKIVRYSSGNTKTLSNLCSQNLVTGLTGWSPTRLSCVLHYKSHRITQMGDQGPLLPSCLVCINYACT